MECPRCNGLLVEDPAEEDVHCVNCGYRRYHELLRRGSTNGSSISPECAQRSYRLFSLEHRRKIGEGRRRWIAAQKKNKDKEW